MYELTTGVTISFSGETKRMILNFTTSGATIDASVIYGAWKTWVIESGSSFLQAFDRSGGETIIPGQNITYYYILMNGWKIIAHTLLPNQIEFNLNGNILTKDNSNPFSLSEGVGNFFVKNILSTNIVTVASDSCTGITEQLTSIENSILAHRLETEDRIKYILGLVQQNFRIFGQVYNEKNLLTSATIRIFNNSTDATNNTNPLKEYSVEATYDSDGRVINYLVID